MGLIGPLCADVLWKAYTLTHSLYAHPVRYTQHYYHDYYHYYHHNHHHNHWLTSW